MVKDILSEIFTRIRNAIYVKQNEVEVPSTCITRSLANILFQEGLLSEVLIPSSVKQGRKFFMFLRLKYYDVKNISVITNLYRVSCSSLRIYVNYKEVCKILNSSSLAILSTSQGFITDREARHCKLGGEFICLISLIYESSFFCKEIVW